VPEEKVYIMWMNALIEWNRKAGSLRAVMLGACALCMVSCASSGSGKIEALTIDDAQRVIVVGKSTKADVKQAFGDADVIPFSSGEEVWIYQAKKGSILKSIPVASRFAGDDGKFKELKIVFDKNSVAKKFQLLDTQ
jgi:hypothetical protein